MVDGHGAFPLFVTQATNKALDDARRDHSDAVSGLQAALGAGPATASDAPLARLREQYALETQPPCV